MGVRGSGLPYAVQTVAFDGRETNHLAQQPFGQVPFLRMATWRSSRAARGCCIWPGKARG